jgi:hypothetical protein
LAKNIIGFRPSGVIEIASVWQPLIIPATARQRYQPAMALFCGDGSHNRHKPHKDKTMLPAQHARRIENQ